MEGGHGKSEKWVGLGKIWYVYILYICVCILYIIHTHTTIKQLMENRLIAGIDGSQRMKYRWPINII